MKLTRKSKIGRARFSGRRIHTIHMPGVSEKMRHAFAGVTSFAIEKPKKKAFTITDPQGDAAMLRKLVETGQTNGRSSEFVVIKSCK